MTIQTMAQDFSVSALTEIADAAAHRARLLIELEPKPWRRSKEQNDMIAHLHNLAYECRAIVAIGKGEPVQFWQDTL